MQSNQKIKNAVAAAVTVLKQGGVLLYPTDTVWGLGCDATNEAAVKRIYHIKQRAMSKSLIVLAKDIAQIEQYCPCLTPKMRTALSQNDRPTTVILPEVTGLATGVGAADGSVAFRIPRHDFCQALITAFGQPIVSTSANLSGETTPVCFNAVQPTVSTLVDGIVPADFEAGATHRPSRIFLFDTNGDLSIVRD